MFRPVFLLGAGVAQSVLRLATGWTVRGSNPGGGEVFRTRPDRPCGPPSILYIGYRVSFPWVEQQGRGVVHPPPSRAEVKERVELYTYCHSGPSWPLLGWNLPLPVFMSHMFVTLDVYLAVPIATVLRLERNRRLARMKEGQQSLVVSRTRTQICFILTNCCAVIL
jgi:hypothetical protein